MADWVINVLSILQDTQENCVFRILIRVRNDRKI